MTIASLFIHLGIKGSDGAKKQLKAIDGGMKEIASSGLAAKAMIVGVVYAMERMMSQSARAGLGIQQFANYTGMSADALQRWQYMFKMSGVQAEEVATSLQQMQSAMVRWKMGEGPPKGLREIALAVGDIDISKAEDAMYILTKLRKYAQSEKRVGFANEMLSSFGLSPAVIASLRTSRVELDKIPNSVLYSGKTVEQLSKVSAGYAHLGEMIEHGIGRLTAKHGMDWIKGLNKVVPQVLELVGAFSELAKAAHAFDGLTMVFKGWALIFKEITDAVKFLTASMKASGTDITNADGSINKEKMDKEIERQIKMKNGNRSGYDNPLYWLDKVFGNPNDPRDKSLPKPKSLPENYDNRNKGGASIQIQQQLNFNNDGTEAPQILDAHSKAVQQAYRQAFSQGMVT